MAATTAVNTNGFAQQVDIGSATATSSDTETVIATLDARMFAFGSITAKNTGAQSVTINIYGSNDPAFADEGVGVGTTPWQYKTIALAAGAISPLWAGVASNITTPNQWPMAYYRIKIVNTTTGAGHASALTVYWCMKNT